MTRFPLYDDDAAREGAAAEPADAQADERADEAVTQEQAPKPARPKRARKSGDSAPPSNIVHLPSHATDTPQRGDEADETDHAFRELEAQGFSADEASRIVVLSERLADSHEAREAEATLRRLRFTRWLVEHGMLDEWSA